MAKPEVPPKSKLFIGILYSDDTTLAAAEKNLTKKYGPLEFKSPAIQFNHPEYYEEIGPALKKQFLLFKRLIKRESISGIKLFTNRVEELLSPQGHRIINIDPGYITLANVFIASCKEFYHRTYLGRGIYLENEYRYISGKYSFWEWTSEEFKKKEYLDFFYAARNMYQEQIKDQIF